MEKTETTIKMTAPPKLAMLNDMAGYGRCALTAAIPVASALRVQCCPVPTAILSNHAGYPSCFFDDYTDRLEAYTDEWKNLGFQVDGIMTGFLASARQAEIAADFIRYFKREKTMVLIDPTMGDGGRLYRVCSEEICDAMKELLPYADIITPNLTEACLLTDTAYEETGFSRRRLADLTYKLQLMGAGAVVLTGVVKGSLILNVIHERGKEPVFQTARHIPGSFHGTGDIFSAVVGASVVRGVELNEAVRRAAAFTRKCVERSIALGVPEREGLCLEECLSYLMKFTD